MSGKTDTQADQLALDLVIRTLDRQATVLGELRARAGVVLAATAIVVSLSGPRALKHGLDGSESFALGVFTLGIIACVCVLWPVRIYALGHLPKPLRQDWRRDVDLERLLIEGEEYEVAGRPSRAFAPGSRGLRPSRGVQGDEPALDRKSLWLTAACVLLVVQVGLWAVTPS